MTDTPETLQSALDDLRARHNEAMKSLAKWSIDVDNAVVRVAAFEKAQKQADVEPPRVKDSELDWMESGESEGSTLLVAAREIRHLRAELARLREGLAPHPIDVPPELLRSWTDGEYSGTSSERMALEVQRHRKLVSK